MTTWVTGPGNYNVICDVCGFKKKASEVRRRWDGLMVCPEDWEMRHPMDFFRTKNDTVLLPFTRPDNNGLDVSATNSNATRSTSDPGAGDPASNYANGYLWFNTTTGRIFKGNTIVWKALN